MRLGQIVLRLHDQMRPADLEMQTRPPKESCLVVRIGRLIDLDAAAAQERSNPENERSEEQNDADEGNTDNDEHTFGR